MKPIEKKKRPIKKESPEKVCSVCRAKGDVQPKDMPGVWMCYSCYTIIY